MRKWNYSFCEMKIDDVATISDPKDNTLMFATTKKWNIDNLENLKQIKGATIIVEAEIADDFKELKGNNIIIAENSRLAFAKLLKKIIDKHSLVREYRVEKNVTVGENVVMGDDCLIEPGVFIDHDVIIGNNVTLRTGVVIRKNTYIGNNTIVGENTVIGAQGLGVETDEKTGEHFRIPHIGGVHIGNNVEIGALTSIVAGTIKPTVIEDNCFIDDLNHIAHNCYIGKRTITTGCVELSGSANIGFNSYLSPNCTVRNGIKLGSEIFVGQASSVQKSFGDNVSIVGNPAREFER